jgi:hypothetical protein
MDPLFATQLGVFINALTLTLNPIPVIKSVSIASDGNLLISAQAQYTGQPLTVQESSDLVHWQNAADAVTSIQTGPVLMAEFPFSARQMFYRVVYQPLGPQ